ncbi:uncharacterized protein TRUGW13939_01651 [Talaromyces rugulosus]|uniref:gamma-glutamylcyclotransferase n=1 Tax=Talaromyces rugulosus TaxID=121627 RepID=A0A7H8QKW9_TALRU|nr:uncharacterized protein TRUGW13939_01651 [Talaromyces rugulosus]QKX54564.1 hypothetical protein TRUGW13939_01651 [Talaromyces rugulosus]
MACRLPRISAARLAETTKSASTDAEKEDYAQQQKTVLYLAYGSNLSTETFRGRRGINPLSQINVYVPDLKLTFDLAGIPYIEPCFAGSRYRSETNTAEEKETARYRDETAEAEACIAETANRRRTSSSLQDEKVPLVDVSHDHEYHKDRWCKPLIGVVYEVTLEDYSKIIATEGGGNGYRDITIKCYPFPDQYDSSQPTPDTNPTTPFIARTLLSPWKPDNTHDDPRMRPDPSYAQPSARYMQLLMNGAQELDLPQDYRHFLAGIRPYTITTWRQKIGKALFLARWGPLLLSLMGLQRVLADDRGIMPPWLASIQEKAFKAVWNNYDGSFRRIFGDGERTIGDV